MTISVGYTIAVALLLVVLVTISFQNLVDSPAKFVTGSLKFSNRDRSSIPIVQLQSKFTGSDPGLLRAHFLSSGSKHSVASAGEQSSINRKINLTGLNKKVKTNEVAAGLARARAAIRREAASGGKRTVHVNDIDFPRQIPSSIYRNPQMFFRSYKEMEKRFKVYVYEEGEVPMVHYGPCKEIYSIEGRFIHEMEQGGGKLRTRDPQKAHAFFLPFSVTMMVQYLYKPLSYNLSPLRNFVSDYVDVISTRYPFWNSTLGADHFMLACHDWGPHASEGNKHLYNKSIRVLCNANSSEGFNPQKDVSLPEIHLISGHINPRLLAVQFSANATSHRPHLAFFAGGVHGPIRPILLRHWKDKDPNLLVYEYLPKGLDYYQLMTDSRFCLCPSGYEVASPRIVEAIYADCVPVIISRSYVLPFSDVLRWEAFSIRVDVDEIPRLKEMLLVVSEAEYTKLIEGVRAVRRHFVINRPAKRFDAFHMIMHSVWLRRLNLEIS